MATVISTEKFLDVVLPEGNHYIGYTDGTLNKAGRPLIKCSVFETGLQGVTVAKQKGDTDIYFALASFKQAKIYDEAKGYQKSYRKEENVDKLKALWLDIDTKNYESKKACVEDIGRFLTDLPKPTFIVDSGGGFHLYWVFEEAITQQQWVPLAQGLAALAKTKGLKADYGVTIDSARVLRLPGTRNQKYDDKPTCTVKAMGAYAHLGRMDELLRPHAAGMARTNLTLDPKVVALFDPATANDLSAGYSEGRRSFFADIAKECLTVQDSLERQGNGDSYALWKDLLHLAAFTEDGDQYAHEISKGDPRYDPDNVEDFYGQSVDIRLKGLRGPTLCQRFSTHSPKCATCPHLGNIKTPWVLGVPIEEKGKQVPSYVRNGATYVHKMVESADGGMELEEVRLVDFELDNWELVPAVDEASPFHLWVGVKNGNRRGTVKLTAEQINDNKQFRVAMFNGGAPLTSQEVNAVNRVATNWASHLTKIRSGVEYSTAGWNPDATAFVMGNRAYTAEGSHPVINPALAKSNTLGAKGKPGPWNNLAQTLLDDEEAAFTYLFCAGFAAPLMGVLNTKCSMSISAYSADSGAGKTTVLRTIRAAFGEPRSGLSLNDTANFIVAKIGAERGLPAIYDEIRGHDRAEAITQVLFAMTEGKTKGRMDTSANMREQQLINTMMLCGSNVPISDYVNQSIRNSNAGYARFLEIELRPKPNANPQLDALVSQLDSNYGHFGPTYIQTIIANLDKLTKFEVEIANRLQSKRRWTAEERFWLQGTTKIIVAGLALNMTGEVTVDMNKLIAYCLKVIDGQREEMVSSGRNEDVLVESITANYAEEMMVSDRVKRKRGPGTVVVHRHPQRSTVHVHVAVKEKILRIKLESLREYATKVFGSYTNTKKSLMRKYNARQVRGAWCAGTNYATAGAVEMLELDLQKLPDGDEIISSWLQAGDKPSTSSPTATPGSSTDAQP